MAKVRTNTLRRIKLVHDIVQQHYIDGITTYSGIWDKYVNKVYPMSYATFIRYINTAVPKAIRDEEEAKKASKPVQTRLFGS